LKELWRQIDRELGQSEIQPGEIGQGPTGRRKHQSHVALRRHETEREGALPACGQKQESSEEKNNEEHHEGKHRDSRCEQWGGKETSTDVFHDGCHEDEKYENIEAVDSLFLPFDGR